MKTWTFYPALFIVSVLFVFSACKKEQESPPLVRTGNIVDVGATNITVVGEIISDGGSEIISAGFCWSKQQNPTLSDSHVDGREGIGAFWKSITGLDYGTTYYIRTFATNASGTAYGSQLVITTIPTPLTVTASLNEKKSTSVQLEVSVLSNGDPTVTERGVCWGITNPPTVADNKTCDGNGTGTFFSRISSLTPLKTYFFRPYASDGKIISYGGVITVITPAPLAITAWIKERGTDFVVIDASVLSDGGSQVTERGVCWGTNDNPTILNNKTTDGAGGGSFTTRISGLTPNTTYYFRAYATNSTGTVYSFN